jgi:sulfide dehydrogenase cytochrome subunit
MDDIEECDSCHGKDGVSTESDVPSIAGVSPFIIEEYMFEYRDEARICRESKYRAGDTDRPATDMCAIARELSEEEIPEIAEYYGTKEFVAAAQDFDAEKAAVGKKLHRRDCEKCHSDGGSYADDDAGMLAGQWMPYLEQAFAEYASGERGMLDEKMKEKIDPLDAESIEALLHYYASLQ